MKVVREPEVAGMFYPSSRNKLKDEVQKYLSNAVVQTADTKIYGLVSPHAGYLYSGLTAAYGFNTISKTSYNTVIILSPSHYQFFRGNCIYAGDAYTTPFGEIPLDKKIIKEMTTDTTLIFEGFYGHGREHGIEVQLPFLQYLLGDFSLVPVVMGNQDDQEINALASKLMEVISGRDDILIIASSDLSHFYPRRIADGLDSKIERHICNFDETSLSSDLHTKTVEACGGGLIVAMMKALKAKGIKHSSVLHRTDSGAVTGDLSEVVGYLSAVFH